MYGNVSRCFANDCPQADTISVNLFTLIFMERKRKDNILNFSPSLIGESGPRLAWAMLRIVVVAALVASTANGSIPFDHITHMVFGTT